MPTGNVDKSRDAEMTTEMMHREEDPDINRAAENVAAVTKQMEANEETRKEKAEQRAL